MLFRSKPQDRERERELVLSVCLGVRGFLIKAAESLSIPLLQRTSSSSVVLFLCLSLQPGLALSLSSSVTLSLPFLCFVFEFWNVGFGLYLAIW